MKKALQLIIGLALLLTFNACAEKSPADEIASLIEQRAAAIDRTSTPQEAFEVASTQQAEFMPEFTKIVETNPDYRLTDDDRQRLKTAIHNFLEVSYKKSTGFNGEKPENLDASINSTMQNVIDPIIDNATTLGQLSSSIRL